MSTYVKLAKSCSDQAVDLTQVNQFTGNMQAINDAFSVQHGTVELQQQNNIGGGGGAVGGHVTLPGAVVDAGHDAIGHHNSPLIARGVLTMKLSTYFGYGLVDWGGNGKVQVSNPTTGLWYLNVPGLYQMWAMATPGTSLTTGAGYPTTTECFPAYDIAGIPGVIVRTGQYGGAGNSLWVLEQQPFSVLIYGHATPWSPDSAGFPAPTGMLVQRWRQARRWLPSFFRRNPT